MIAKEHTILLKKFGSKPMLMVIAKCITLAIFRADSRSSDIGLPGVARRGPL